MQKVIKIKLFNIGQSYEVPVPVPVKPHTYEKISNLTATTPNIYKSVDNNDDKLLSLKQPPLTITMITITTKKINIIKILPLKLYCIQYCIQ